MALEDRIRSSVDQAVQSLVADLVSIHQDESSRQQDEAAALARESEHRVRTDLEQRLAAAEADRQQAIDAAVAEAEARVVAATQSSVDAALVVEREAEMAGFSRLVESIRGLDGATSLSEVLDALALAAGREAARAAVVVVKGDHAVGWRLSGFGTRDAQPKSVDLPLADAGVIGVAVSSSRAATTRNGAADGPGFEHLPEDRIGLAMPVLVGGRAVAVVYADGVTEGQEQTVPSPWPEAIEVLARHAGRCLEALTAQKTGGTTAAARHAAIPPGAAG